MPSGIINICLHSRGPSAARANYGQLRLFKRGTRINTKIGYGSAKATIPIPALVNIGYGIDYCTPLLHLVCVAVLSK